MGGGRDFTGQAIYKRVNGKYKTLIKSIHQKRKP